MAGVFGNFKETSPLSGGDRTQEKIDVLNNKVTATRYFVGPWDERFDFIFTYLVQEISDNAGVTTWTDPHVYPDMKSLYVSDIEVEGEGTATFDGDEEKSIWQRARITVTYARANPISRKATTDRQNNQSDYTDYVYVDESIDSHLEMLQIPGKAVEKDDDADPPVKLHEEGVFNKVIVMASIVLNRDAIIRPPWGATGRLLGKVNKSTFITPSGFTCPPKTLRFDGPSGNTKVNVLDRSGLLDEQAFPVPVWDYTMKFEFNRQGWNNRYVEGVLVPIKTPDGKPFYELGDLWDLILGETEREPGFALELDNINTAQTALDAYLDADDANAITDPTAQTHLQSIRTARAALGFSV